MKTQQIGYWANCRSERVLRPDCMLCRFFAPQPSRATPSTVPYPCPAPVHGAVSVFHTDPWRCHEAVPRVQNRKSACSATFLRLGIVTDPCNRRLGRKSAGGLLQSGCFRLCGGRGESLIAKKLQKRSDFCFCGRWIAAAGQISQRADRCGGADVAKGGSPQRGRLRKELVQRGGGVSAHIHFAVLFACDDVTVCVTECAPFLVGSSVVGSIVCGVLGAHERGHHDSGKGN